MMLNFPASPQGRGGREPCFVLELSKFMARSKIVGKLPLGGVFECAMYVGIGIFEGIYDRVTPSGFGLKKGEFGVFQKVAPNCGTACCLHLQSLLAWVAPS